MAARVACRIQNLAAGAHRRPAPADLDADRMRLAVAIARIRFDANQVVAGELGFDSFEERRLRGRDREQRPARCAGQQLEALAARLAIADRIDRGAALRYVEHLILEAERVQACARFGGEPPELDDHRLVVQHESF